MHIINMQSSDRDIESIEEPELIPDLGSNSSSSSSSSPSSSQLRTGSLMVPSVVARMMDPNAGVIGMLQLILLVTSQCALVPEIAAPERSEEHTSELQSRP